MSDVNSNIDLSVLQPVTDNVSYSWVSNHPEIISNEGRYNPIGLESNTKVTLTEYITSGNFFWQKNYNVTALSEANAASTADWQTGMLAHYTFDSADILTNKIAPAETAQLKHNGTNADPKIETGEALRNGGVAHLTPGAVNNESYVAIPNPLLGKSLEDGVTISFFVKRLNDWVYDAIFGAIADGARFFITPNLYVGYNNGKESNAEQQVYNNWLDINHPTTGTNEHLGQDRWHMLTVTVSRKVSSLSGGVTIYVDGVQHKNDQISGLLNSSEITSRQAFNYNYIVDTLAVAPELYLGFGSYWGTPNVMIDELTIHERALSSSQVKGLYQMLNRADASYEAEGIETLTDNGRKQMDDRCYDLFGRRVKSLKSGLYIRNGKKILIK